MRKFWPQLFLARRPYLSSRARTMAAGWASEGEMGDGIERPVGALAAPKAMIPRGGDHGAIVRAPARRRNVEGDAPLLRERPHGGPQAPVAGDPSGEDERAIGGAALLLPLERQRRLA